MWDSTLAQPFKIAFKLIDTFEGRRNAMGSWSHGDDMGMMWCSWFIGLFYSILFAFLEDEEEDLDVDVVDDEECKKAEDIHWMKFQ